MITPRLAQGWSVSVRRREAGSVEQVVEYTRAGLGPSTGRSDPVIRCFCRGQPPLRRPCGCIPLVTTQLLLGV